MIQFKYTIDMLTVATPSSGYIIGYDLDGILKQKDTLGVISQFGGGPTGPTGSTGVTPSFSDTLSVSNITGTNDIVMSFNQSIRSATGGSYISLDDNASGPDTLFRRND